MTLLLQIYIIGCIAAFVMTILWEGKMLFNWNYSLMSANEWMQDILGSFLSWITVLLVVFMFYYTPRHPEVKTRDCDKKRNLKAYKAR